MLLKSFRKKEGKTPGKLQTSSEKRPRRKSHSVFSSRLEQLRN